MKAELLAPAGNFYKLKTALYFGADAAYIGGKNFSLRSFADNFDGEQLKSAVDYAHSLNKKVYVTVNILARNADFALLDDYLKYLEDIGADAAIISDVGVLSECRKVAPKLNVHISTQASTLNKYAVKFFKDCGASRVILARELSLKEIAEIHDFVPEIELEAFVHGAMCISYSGRCLLSDYLDGRSSNRGACVQACRWKYQIRKAESGKESGWLDLQEDGRGAYILNSKDLNMSAHLDKMLASGITSFKIEGRMKSEYYLATIVNAYRRCMDEGYTQRVEDELKNAAHRDYTTAYMLGANSETVSYDDSQTKGGCDYIGNVISCERGKCRVEMRTRFKVGERLEALTPSGEFLKSFEVKSAQTSQGEGVTDCKLVQEIYTINCPLELKQGDILRRRK